MTAGQPSEAGRVREARALDAVLDEAERLARDESGKCIGEHCPGCEAGRRVARARSEVARLRALDADAVTAPLADKVREARSLLDGLTCLDRDDETGRDRCNERAVAIPWGTLYAKNQVGPKCAKHLRLRHPDLGAIIPGPLSGVAAVVYLTDLHRALADDSGAPTDDDLDHLSPAAKAVVREINAPAECGSTENHPAHFFNVPHPGEMIGNRRRCPGKTTPQALIDGMAADPLDNDAPTIEQVRAEACTCGAIEYGAMAQHLVPCPFARSATTQEGEQ